MKLTCMRGFPGSGKSTVARNLPGVVVCRDDLRMQLYGSYHVGKDGEDTVTVAERALVRALLRAGNDVVIDAMHVNPRYLKFWAKVASEIGAEFEVHDVRTPIRNCEANNEGRDKEVGENVIAKIARQWPETQWPTITAPPKIEVQAYVRPSGRPAIIVDIDGTLAHYNGRSPYDYSRVSEDKPDAVIRDLVDREWSYGYDILVTTGRDDSCRADTHAWLTRHHVPVDELFMRPADAMDHYGNKLPDWVVKLDLFNKYIRNNYDIEYVLDDRNQVVSLWRKLGLTCLQVAEGDF